MYRFALWNDHHLLITVFVQLKHRSFVYLNGLVTKHERLNYRKFTTNVVVRRCRVVANSVEQRDRIGDQWGGIAKQSCHGIRVTNLSRLLDPEGNGSVMKHTTMHVRTCTRPERKSLKTSWVLVHQMLHLLFLSFFCSFVDKTRFRWWITIFLLFPFSVPEFCLDRALFGVRPDRSCKSLKNSFEQTKLAMG